MTTVTSGSMVGVVCQKQGDAVPGPNGLTVLWDKVKNPSAGYISDQYIRTGTNGPLGRPCS